MSQAQYLGTSVQKSKKYTAAMERTADKIPNESDDAEEDGGGADGAAAASPDSTLMLNFIPLAQCSPTVQMK